MSISRELLSSLLKYSKRKQRSISPTIPGYAGQSDFVKPRTRVPGDNYVIPHGSVSVPEVYMGDLPDDYIPDAGFMEIFEPDYGPYIPQSFQAPIPPVIGGVPKNFEVVGVEYNDSLMTSELFEHQMEMANNLDFMPHNLEQMVEMQANQDFIDGTLEMDPIDVRLMTPGDMVPMTYIPPDVINTGDAFQMPAVEPLPGPVNYAAMDPQDFFDKQMQMMDNHFEQFDPGLGMDTAFNAQGALFDISQSAMPFEPVGIPGVGSLDDIIEASMQQASAPAYGPEMSMYDNGPMTQELFEQQMHEAVGPMGVSEAAPDPYDDGMMPDQMYGEVMPYDMMEPDMMDPYMMDPHMMNPYMMPGPMGPNFMPDPPPGP